MGLLSIFQRKKQTAARPARSGRPSKGSARQATQAPAANAIDTAEAVREARARARRRLIGATVLLLVGVIGFPLLFETQPRPVPVDLPIEIPSRTAAGAETPPLRAHAEATSTTPSAVVARADRLPAPDDAPAAPATAPPVPSARASALASLAASLRSNPAVSGSATGGASAAQASAYLKPVRPPAPASAAAAGNSGAAAAALLAGKTPDVAAEGGRFVVQVGAFAEDAKVREARGKVEKLGMKTYTQSVDTPAGKRIRVRAGPYASKADADSAAARIKANGLPAVVLIL